MLFSILLPLSLDKGCLCVYSSGYGFDVLPQLQYSTNWIRALQLPSQICDSDQICHLYATLPENAMNEVFINVQTGTNIKEIKLQIGIQLIQCQQFQFPSKIENRGQRNIFTCYAKQLQPNTRYPIIIMNFQGKYLKESTYQTPPLKQDLTLFFGGDFGYQTAGIDIVRTLTQVNPHVILIGGDVAYDNGNPNCYYSWDLFLNIFEEQFTQMGRIIPFIFSIGNHDVGYNEYANYNVTVSEENGPLYFSYFPQRANQNGEIESIPNRVTFNVHILHKLAIYGLDSGYLYPHNATQLDWLQQKSAQYQNLRKIAHYHVPMYPTCFSNSSFMTKWDKIKFSQEIWVPVFDQYEFKAAFENHVHQYKRSYPMKNNVRAEGGTVYFGDGSMGVVAEKCPEYAQTYQKGRPFEGLFQEVRTEHSEHFWVMVSGEEQLNFIAYNPEYKVIQGSQYRIKNDL